MKLVVDSNVLFTFFWKSSTFKEISLNLELDLCSPVYALEEINKYSSEILNKTGLPEEEFKKLKLELARIIMFIPLEEYSIYLKQATLLAKKLSDEEKLNFLKDIDFFALALKLSFPIWSNDKLFKKQSRVPVFTTKEIVELLSIG